MSIDEVSRTLGRMEASIEGIERYIHDKKHDTAEISTKIDAVVHLFEKRIAAVERRDARIDGGWSVIDWIVRSNLVGWLVAAAIAVWAYLNGGKP